MIAMPHLARKTGTLLTPFMLGGLMLGAAVIGLSSMSQTAAANPLGLAQNGSGGLEVESDNGIEWRRNEQVLIARGNAVAKRGGSRVDADELAARGHQLLSTSTSLVIEAWLPGREFTMAVIEELSTVIDTASTARVSP